MATVYVRNIPESDYESLRESAAEHGHSISAELRRLGARHVNDPPKHAASPPDRPGDASPAAA